MYYSAIITSHVSGEVLNRSVQLIYISGELQPSDYNTTLEEDAMWEVVEFEDTPCPAINITCKGVVLSSPFSTIFTHSLSYRVLY